MDLACRFGKLSGEGGLRGSGTWLDGVRFKIARRRCFFVPMPLTRSSGSRELCQVSGGLPMKSSGPTSSTSRRVLLLMASLLLLAVVLAILFPVRQQYPRLFFTAECRNELTALSTTLLSRSGSSKLGLSRKSGVTKIAYGSGLPADLLNYVNDVLRSRRLRYVYVDKERGTVAWRSVFLQTGAWYMYGTNGLSQADLPPEIRSVERLDSDWFSFLR